MFVRNTRLQAAGRVERLAALHDCRFVLQIFGGSLAALVGVISMIELTPGLYIEDVHTHMPALIAGAVLALTTQGIAVGVSYRDHLTSARRRMDPRRMP